MHCQMRDGGRSSACIDEVALGQTDRARARTWAGCVARAPAAMGVRRDSTRACDEGCNRRQLGRQSEM